MFNLRFTLRTTVVLVDHNVQQLDARTLSLKMLGFSVVSACGPIQAISIMRQGHILRADVAVINYEMPGVNGCVLAEYLRTRYPGLKIVVYSVACDLSQEEMTNVDAFLSKGAGMDEMGTLIAALGGNETATSAIY